MESCVSKKSEIVEAIDALSDSSVLLLDQSQIIVDRLRRLSAKFDNPPALVPPTASTEKVAEPRNHTERLHLISSGLTKAQNQFQNIINKLEEVI